MAECYAVFLGTKEPESFLKFIYHRLWLKILCQKSLASISRRGTSGDTFAAPWLKVKALEKKIVTRDGFKEGKLLIN